MLGFGLGFTRTPQRPFNRALVVLTIGYLGYVYQRVVGGGLGRVKELGCRVWVSGFRILGAFGFQEIFSPRLKQITSSLF